MTIKLKPLSEQVVLITGATSGIGLLTARTAAARGASVMLVARGEAGLRDAVAAIEAAGGTAGWAVADVGDAAQVRAAAAAAVARFGRIDAWVNVAGVTIYAPLTDTPDDEHQRLFRTNYFGTVHGCLTALRHLKDGGALVTVASIVADMPAPLQGAYAASKNAVRAYVEALRIEQAAAGVPVSISLVKPAGVATPIAHHAAAHIDAKPQVPPPAYDPQLVADAILRACEHPVRDITVGGVGRAEVLFAAHFPRLFEWLAPIGARSFVAKGRPPAGNNLFRPTADPAVASPDQPARKTSLYTAAALHPGITAVAGAGIAAAAAVLWTRRRRADQ